MLRIENYAKEHPDCSLQEYVNFLKENREKNLEAKRLRRVEANKLLKSLIGKCFRVEYYNQSTTYFKITKDTAIGKEIREEIYRINVDSGSVSVYSAECEIPHRWLLNQNETPKCEMISEEEFNRVVDYCQEIFKIVNEIGK